ncbi:hypothetical protein GWK47_048528 [Chionoecetes opilio]|uniref:DDE-1 domain-containing protein n=1 Tax=Chionoecetes opilio TaxID=41210 RepID=A0A8J5CS80_CHIOP|nr:hypothetical protein GWK47_048528 [Chionoecetes opilio]
MYTNITPASQYFARDAFNRSRKRSDGNTFVPLKVNAHRVFTDDEETILATYTMKIAKMFYGLPRTEFRKLAYRYALACKAPNIPKAWDTSRAATSDWYYAYVSRHPHLTLEAPEGRSIARAIAPNKTSVNAFFEAYTEAMENHQFTPDRILNLGEASLSMAMKPVKVVCEKGQPVASQISGERGATMTFVGIISAAGHYIPPVFIIPGQRWNDLFMRGTIDGSKGILHENGCMNGECFLQTLQHVQAKTCCSPNNKVLLIMDNAECHMSIHAIEYAQENGIVILTLPPHTTDKLQPLDVSVFGPFKFHMRALFNDYALMNPQAHGTEHLLPEIASKAWLKSCTPSTVLSGYKATGIWPINRNSFTDDDFIFSSVSERPEPPQQANEEDENLVNERVGLHLPTPSTTNEAPTDSDAAEVTPTSRPASSDGLSQHPDPEAPNGPTLASPDSTESEIKIGPLREKKWSLGRGGEGHGGRGGEGHGGLKTP